MTTQAPQAAGGDLQPIEKIVVRIKVGDDLMASTVDPVFLRLHGPAGRDFRLSRASGKDFRKGHEEILVIGSPQDPETNLAHPELNDPTSPALDLAGIRSVRLVKGLEPLPNVRGFGEMDDRLLVAEAEVLVYVKGQAPARFYREGPHWLGLICGLTLELPRQDPPA